MASIRRKKKSLVYQRVCGVQNSGPWDPWLLVVENSRLFAQRADSARCAPLDKGGGGGAVHCFVKSLFCMHRCRRCVCPFELKRSHWRSCCVCFACAWFCAIHSVCAGRCTLPSKC